MVNRIDFDNLLSEISVKRGLNLHENEEFIRFNREKKYLKVTTNRHEYKINTLIGADGSLSKVRTAINPSKKNNLAPTLEVFAPSNKLYDQEFEEKKIVVDLSYIKKGLQGYFWHVPCLREDIPTIGHGIVDFRIHRKKVNNIMKKIFEDELKKRKITSDKKNWLSHPIRYPTKNDKISSQNILLVGDAIGIEPAFGGGIHFALSYGELAAKEIINAYKNQDYSFNTYEDRIYSHIVGKFMKKCRFIAKKLYSGKMDPFKAAEEVFTIKENKLKHLSEENSYD